MRKPAQPRGGLLAFLITLLKAAAEFLRYDRSVRYMRRVHFSLDHIIYCLKKSARETTLGQRVSITIETAGGKLTIAVDTDQRSPTLEFGDELFQQWKEARESKGD